jgi:hypothetical protein
MKVHHKNLKDYNIILKKTLEDGYDKKSIAHY